MSEVLYEYSVTTIVLSAIAIGMAIYAPAMLGQKVHLKKLPRSHHQFVIINLFWMSANLVGTLLCHGPEHTVLRQVVFGLGALGWVQLGNCVLRISENSFYKVHFSHFWSLLNIGGAVSVITATLLLIFNYDGIANFSLLGYMPFQVAPVSKIFFAIYIVFVLYPLCFACFQVCRISISTNDESLAQINTYMAASAAFFIILAILLDFVVPLATKSTLGQNHFLLWTGFCSVLLAIISSQYFTSVSFKNKSSAWLLDKIILKLNDGVIFFDNQGQIFFVNQAGQNLLQCNETSLIHGNIKDFFPAIADFQEANYSNMALEIHGEKRIFDVSIFSMKESMTLQKNILFFSDLTNSIHFQRQIKILGEQYDEYRRDIQRYQEQLTTAKTNLTDSQNFLTTLINALPFRFWSKNEQGVYTSQNQKDIAIRTNLYQTTDPSERISKYEEEARTSGNIVQFTTYENRFHEQLPFEDAQKALNEGSNDLSIFENFFVPIVTNRKPYKIIGLKRDVTEEKKLERERNLLREQKLIHSKLEDLGTMCGAFAHDYNNILGSQIGFCQLAKEIIPADSQAQMFIEQAMKAAQRGKDSLEELLNVIRGRANVQNSEMTFAPYMIIEEVVQRLAITLPPNISIKADKIDRSLKIKGLPASLDRIVSNMANNAIFATKAKGGVISFEIEKVTVESPIISAYAPQINPGNYAKIVISDTGSGIDSSTLERIFSPFFTTKAPGEGLGLGLSSAVKLLKEANASLTVQTTLGEGTTFNLYWPME